MSMDISLIAFIDENLKKHLVEPDYRFMNVKLQDLDLIVQSHIMNCGDWKTLYYEAIIKWDYFRKECKALTQIIIELRNEMKELQKQHKSQDNEPLIDKEIEIESNLVSSDNSEFQFDANQKIPHNEKSTQESWQRAHTFSQQNGKSDLHRLIFEIQQRLIKIDRMEQGYQQEKHDQIFTKQDTLSINGQEIQKCVQLSQINDLFDNQKKRINQYCQTAQNEQEQLKILRAFSQDDYRCIKGSFKIDAKLLQFVQYILIYLVNSEYEGLEFLKDEFRKIKNLWGYNKVEKNTIKILNQLLQEK